MSNHRQREDLKKKGIWKWPQIIPTSLLNKIEPSQSTENILFVTDINIFIAKLSNVLNQGLISCVWKLWYFKELYICIAIFFSFKNFTEPRFCHF